MKSIILAAVFALSAFGAREAVVYTDIANTFTATQTISLAGSNAFALDLQTQGTTASGGYLRVVDAQAGVARGFLGYGSAIFSGGAVTDFGLRSEGALVFATNGATIRTRIDTSGNVGIGVSSPVATLDIAGNFHLSSGATIYGAGDLYMRAGPSGILRLGANDANSLIIIGTSGKFTTYANVATVGWGVPAVYATGRVTGQTATGVTVLTFTTPASDGSYLLTGVTTITAYTSGTIGLIVTWTGEDGTVNSTSYNGASSGVQQIVSGAIQLRVKASTTITVKSTAGPFSLTYNAEAYLLQIG